MATLALVQTFGHFGASSNTHKKSLSNSSDLNGNYLKATAMRLATAIALLLAQSASFDESPLSPSTTQVSNATGLLRERLVKDVLGTARRDVQRWCATLQLPLRVDGRTNTLPLVPTDALRPLELGRSFCAQQARQVGKAAPLGCAQQVATSVIRHATTLARAAGCVTATAAAKVGCCAVLLSRRTQPPGSPEAI